MSIQFVPEQPRQRSASATRAERLAQPVCVVACLRAAHTPVALRGAEPVQELPLLPPALRSKLVRTWHGRVEEEPRDSAEAPAPSTSPHPGPRASSPSAAVPRGNPIRIDHLIFTDSVEVTSLPGLEPPFGSRVRDTLGLLADTLPQVDLFLIQTPAEVGLTHTSVLEQLELALAEQTGALVLFPDLLPQAPARAELLQPSPEAQLSAYRRLVMRWAGEVRLLAPRLQALNLITLLDAPLPAPEVLAQLCLNPEVEQGFRRTFGPRIRAGNSTGRSSLLPGSLDAEQPPRPSARALVEEAVGSTLEEGLHTLEGLDGAVVAFTGSYNGLRAHAWRSGAALAVRALVGETDFARAAGDDPVVMARLAAAEVLERRRISLPSPRRCAESLIPSLTPGFPLGFRLPERLSTLLIPLQLQEDEVHARFEGQISLHAPLGRWPLPALRTIKALELHIRKVAEQFVFRPVDELQALELNRILTLGMADYISSGALVPALEDQPLLQTQAVREAPPALVATLQATLRPWACQLRVRLNIRNAVLSLEVQDA